MTLGERMAISAIRYCFKFAYDDVRGLYLGLIHDINRKGNVNRPLSDGYDFAQDAALFLCEFMGRRLNDQVTGKKGNPVSIKLACIKMLTSKLHYKVSYNKKAVCIDDVKNLEEPAGSVEITEEQDLAVAEKIEQMKLTDKQKEVLLLRMAGLTFHQIAKALCKGTTVLFKHLHYVRQKYIQTFQKPVWR